jgi:pre-60S factor REI1
MISTETMDTEVEEAKDETTMDTTEEEPIEEEYEPPEINPLQSLFDNHTSSTLDENISYMTNTYSFYIPDTEYLIDLEGLIGYCSEKIRLGHTCLYCQRIFTSYEGCMKHMRDKRHCKICYERGVDQEEFDVFYDFEVANDEFLGRKKKKDGGVDGAAQVDDDDMDEEEEGEWEDVSEDEDVDNMEEEEDDLYAAYQEEIASHGFDITPLGELIFPDGRIIGHRGLARYYKQRFAPDRMERAAVRAARIAAGDRMYNGRVVNMYRLRGEMEQHGNGGGEGTSALATTMGRMSGSIPTGRNGKGILVNAGGGSTGGGFTSLSLYRYRAAVKKQRREDDKGRRLQYRTKQNMNKMNKKGNIITTGFSTSHAPR